ncbi:MAG TPA: hypothetical protein VFV87_05670 [Pirellulaceae bacterium]|nr:hypothetical protein [Pirellulaceae bacterium]
MRTVQLATLACLLVAGGCCLPCLSGRYCDQPPAADQPQPATKQPSALASQSPMGAEPNHLAHPDKIGHAGLHGAGMRHAGLHDRFHALHGLAGGMATPPGELIPLPKFHPVPVHPVFEPQLDYLIPQPLELQPESASTPPAADGLPTPATPPAKALPGAA